MIWKSSFWLFEILAGAPAVPPSRTHSLPGNVGSLFHMDLSTGLVAFKVEFLERWGGRGSRMGAQGRKDAWKPVFYSAVLGVTDLVCRGTL